MRRNRKGFTLAELLIVVAIIAVLVAVAIPVFTSQMEKSREATDAANIRAQYTQVMAETLSTGENVNVDGSTYGKLTLNQTKDKWQDAAINQAFGDLFDAVEGGQDGQPAGSGTAWVKYENDKVVLCFGDGENNGAILTGDPWLDENKGESSYKSRWAQAREGTTNLVDENGKKILVYNDKRVSQGDLSLNSTPIAVAKDSIITLAKSDYYKYTIYEVSENTNGQTVALIDSNWLDSRTKDLTYKVKNENAKIVIVAKVMKNATGNTANDLEKITDNNVEQHVNGASSCISISTPN